MCDLCKMLLNICREKVAERDAAQARLAEVQFAATGAIERADKAEARVRELEAENRVLRRAHNGPGDLGHYNCAGEFVPPQEWVDAATGRDLRCLMEWMDGGQGHVEVWGPDYVHVYKDSSDDDGIGYATLAEAAAAVREWQAGQVPNGGPDGTRGYHDVAEFYPAQEPAPSPEDAATARIEAAGAKVDETFEWGEWRWVLVAADGERWFVGACGFKPATEGEWDRAAAFADAHRVTQGPEPAPSPEDAARASDGVYHLKPIEAGPAYNVPVATLKPSPVVIGTSATSRPHQGAAVIVNGEYVDAASVVIDGNSIAINKRFEMVPNPFVELVAKWTAEDAVEDAPPDTQDTPCDAPEAPAEG